MSIDELRPLSDDELAAEAGTALPGKEVISLLDLNLDLDLGLDLAAPVDLAVAANANVAAPIDAAVGANVLSEGSKVATLSEQSVILEQGISGDAIATSTQNSDLDQSDGAGGAATAGAAVPAGAAAGAGGSTVAALPDVGAGDLLTGDLLNVDVKVALDADLAAPINGAVAANANVAAPIDAAVGANVGSVDPEATAVAKQTVVIEQRLDDVRAEATADQTSAIDQ